MRTLARALEPLQRRLSAMVGRCIVNLINDAPQWQSLQIELRSDEVRMDVERAQNYGFTSHPHPGAEAVAVAVAGSRDHVIVVAVDDRRYRLRSLAQGEVAIYTDEGDRIVLKRGGTIEVTASTKVRIESPLVELTGDMTVAGSIVAGGDVVGQGTSLHTHRHKDTEPGSGNSGVPL